MKEENPETNSQSSSSKTLLYIILITIVIIIVVIILVLILGKSVKGVDLKIISVNFTQENNFTYPIVTLKNIGNQASTSSFYISMTSKNGGGNWQYLGIIQPGKIAVSNGAGTSILAGDEVTIILDIENQTADVNRNNNIYKTIF